MDIPAYSKALFITDAAINIRPDLDDKRDIIQNAVDLMRILGVDKPLVAVLAAVETVNSKCKRRLMQRLSQLCLCVGKLQGRWLMDL